MDMISEYNFYTTNPFNSKIKRKIKINPIDVLMIDCINNCYKNSINVTLCINIISRFECKINPVKTLRV